MYLLIDAGNSRIKFACHDGHDWLLRTHLEEASLIKENLPAGFTPQRIVIANVAGQRVAEQLQAALDGIAPIEWLKASPQRCGLRCGYRDPARLGPDRWAAAIAAWQRCGGNCMVVSAGTATTIEIIESPGVYAGGIILPGFGMMLDSLANGTAELPRTSSLPIKALHTPAIDTLSAIYHGCMHAQQGAIERMMAVLPPDSPILLTGGYASELAPHVNAQVQIFPWLVMDGLLAVVKTTQELTTG